MRVAVSQRVEVVGGYAERRDCLDQRWVQLAEALDIEPIPIPNTLRHTRRWLDLGGISGLLLTGGNDLSSLPNATNTAPERDATELEALAWAAELRLPVIGVCRGMQMINVFLGGGLRPVDGHVACRHSVRCETPLFDGAREVNSYHGWGLAAEDLATGLVAAVTAGDGSIEAVAAEALPWIGTMWHPEREAELQQHDARVFRHLFAGNRN